MKVAAAKHGFFQIYQKAKKAIKNKYSKEFPKQAES